MFEKTKDKAFQEGIVFASNTDSKKFSMQEAAFNEERKNLAASMEKFHEQLNILVSESEEKEIERIYGLRQEFNYENLEPEQKQLIIAILFPLLKQSSEAQKLYVLNLQNFFGISSPQLNYNINMLSDNDDLSTFANRCIFKIISEFFYLEDETFSFLDNALYQEICENINLNQKRKNEILDSIREISSIDAAFIIAQYGTSSLLAKKEAPVSEETLRQTNTNRFYTNDMTEETITSTLHIQGGERKYIKNSILHFDASVSCESSLEFEHCILYLNESNTANIINLGKEARLTIKNSIVICKNFSSDYFINANSRASITFEKTYFVNCDYFISSSEANSFIIKDCTFENCFTNFADVSIPDDAECKISHSHFILNNLSEPQLTNIKKAYDCKLIVIRPALYNIMKCKPQFTDNTVTEAEQIHAALNANNKFFNPISIFSCINGVVSNCTFNHIASIICARWFSDCKFENCIHGIETSFHGDEEPPIIDTCIFLNSTNIINATNYTQIRDCQFISCYGCIIDAGNYEGGVRIDDCDFYNIKDSLPDKSSENIFNTCIYFRRKMSRGSSCNVIKNCTFNGIDIGQSFLVAAEGGEKLTGPIAAIDACNFKNCVTKRESRQIINHYIQYYDFFNRPQNSVAIIEQKCNGLGNINEESNETDQFEIKTVSYKGNIIGSSLSEPAESFSTLIIY